MAVLIGIDTGTSSTKVVAIDENGTVLGEATRSYEYSQPQPGWAEQRAETWWEAACEAVREMLDHIGAARSHVAAVGFSGQMHGTVMLDDRLQPLGDAIIWPDTRSAAEVKAIRSELGTERLGRLTANPIATGFMAATLLWLRRNDPDRWRRLRHVLLPKDYVRLRLTGSLGTDASDASATLLFDTAASRWSSEMAEVVGLDEALLPPVCDSCEKAGTVSAEGAAATGLAEGTPAVFGGGDLAMAAVGGGAVGPGTACVNIGTGGQFFAVADRPLYDRHLRIHTFRHAAAGRWTIGGALLSAGMALQWFCEKVSGFPSYDEVSAAVASVEPGSGGLLFLPYLAGVRTPHMDPAARGAFVGLTTSHTKAHLARAIAEGVALALRDSARVVGELGVQVNSLVACGGGARSRAWKHMLADVLNSPVRGVIVAEQAAVGAAICAGVGAGVFPGIEQACEQAVQLEPGRIDPEPRNVELYDRLYELFSKLYPNNRQTFSALAAISAGDA